MMGKTTRFPNRNMMKNLRGTTAEKGEITSRDVHLFGTKIEELLTARLSKKTEIFRRSKIYLLRFQESSRNRRTINSGVFSTKTARNTTTRRTTGSARKRAIIHAIHHK